ncbi:glutathione S-transferase GST-6.0-like isoform X2 [Anneissia japonica]|uniref:glutathione S-transferase GST-6.0-like isoform X2 n=1 Tax=Anneissia japonica TaxID=1529436 RepID=UPI001425A3E8|nr:glutathione S-transferase GST-6.0-like isoform X2 [Anneissia japonica]
MAGVTADVVNTTVIGLCVAIGGGAVLTLGSLALARRYRRKAKRPRHMVLYHSFPFRSSRCAWFIAELGIEDKFQVEKVTLHGENMTDMENYKKSVHPHGTIPALKLDNDVIVLESGAICMYLADLFGGLAPHYLERAEYYNWICYATATIDPVLEPLYMQLTHMPEDQRDTALVEKMTNKFKEIAAYLSSVLEKRQYICGDRFTAADCVLGYNMWWASVIQSGAILQDYPVLVDYVERIKQRDGFKKAFIRKPKPSGGSL